MMGSMVIIKFCLRYINRKKSKFIIYILGNIIIAGLSILVAYFTGLFIDRLINEKTSAFLLHFSIIFVALNVINIIMKYTNSIIYMKLLYDHTYFISRDVIKHIHCVPLLQIEKMDAAYLNQRISQDSGTLIGFAMSAISGFATNLLIIVIVFTIMLSISFAITLLILCFLIIYLVLFITFKKPLYKKGLELKEDQGFYFSKMFEQLNFARFVKIHSAKELFKKRLHDAYDAYRKSLLNYHRISTLFSSLDNFVVTLINVFLFIIFGITIINGSVTVGEFIIFTALSTKLVGSFSYFFNFGKTYQDTLVSYNRINDILQWEVEENGLDTIFDIHSIKLDNLRFSFGEKEVIRDFSMKLERGKMYAIVGDNGKGKSTLMNLLMGVYTTQVGEIYFNDERLKDLDSEELRKNKLGIVEQEPTLLNDTMLYNIGLEPEDRIEISNITQIFKILDLNEFIQRLPEGLDTVICSKSTNISGGEKQKLALARLLIKNTDVMIFDEPTSALDESTTNSFIDYIEQIKKNKIIIIITHTTKLMKQCDVIVKI